MKRFIYALIPLMMACGNSVTTDDSRDVVPAIPTSAPTLPVSATPNVTEFPQSVVVEYSNDTVFVSQLPEGVTMSVSGANLALTSSARGVEYCLSGSSGCGSFSLVSNEKVLLSMSSLSLVSDKRDAISVKSPSVIFVRGTGTGVSYIMDGIPGDSVNAPKGAAAIMLDGDAVLCGGNIAVRGERRRAVQCTKRLLLNGTNISIEAARTDGISADSAIIAAKGNIQITAQKDAIKSKRGNAVILNGNLTLCCKGKRGDAIQARNIYQYGGNIVAKVEGVASRGMNSKGAVYLMDGMTNVEASGSAIFAPKKCDYTSGACIKAETHLYIGRAYTLLRNSGDGGKGINCNGVMQMDGGVLRVNVSGNDIQHPEYYDAHTSAKGVKCDSTMLIKSGLIEIVVTGTGERCEGMESKGCMRIEGENSCIYIYAHDDAINTGEELTINNGRIYTYSVANDAIDSNGMMRINGGLVIANGSDSPEMGIDVDRDSRLCFTGGTIITCGGAMGAHPCMPRNNATTQPAVVWCGIDLVRGKYVNIADGSGELLYSYALPRSVKGGAVMLSSAELKKGERYTLSMSSAQAGTQHLGNGLYTDGVINDAEVTVPLNETVTAIDNKGRVEYFTTGSNEHNGFPPPPQHESPAPHDIRNAKNPPPPQHAAPHHRKESEGYNADKLPGGGW